MGFTTSYKTLFELRILHHYFLNKANKVFDTMTETDVDRLLVQRNYDTRQFISITPTPACARLISKYHCIFKTTPLGMIMGVQSQPKNAGFEPVIPLDDDVRFTFLVRFEDSFFTNYTSIPFIKEPGSLYYFQNRTTDSPKKFPYLTQFPPAFSAGEKYSAGEILSDNAANPTKLFVASSIRDAAPPGTDWLNDILIGGQPLLYATKGDLIKLYSDMIRFNTEETDVNPTITIADRWGNTFQPEFVLTSEADNTVVLVDIHNLPEDLLTITIDDPAKPYSNTFSFYRLAKYFEDDCVLELSLKSDTAAYSMIDANGLLREPVYQIRFRNRTLKWRYRGKHFQANPESGPHPLTKFGQIPVTLQNDLNDAVDLPNPDIRMVQATTAANDNKHYDLRSDIFIH